MVKLVAIDRIIERVGTLRLRCFSKPGQPEWTDLFGWLLLIAVMEIDVVP
jgi:hypothetical protein